MEFICNDTEDKISAISPSSINEKEYYGGIWEKETNLLAPLTDLVGECGTTELPKKRGTKKAPWH